MDKVLSLCKQLCKIDNRSHKDLAEAAGINPRTVKKIRENDVAFVRSSTVSAIARALHKEIRVR